LPPEALGEKLSTLHYVHRLHTRFIVGKWGCLVMGAFEKAMGIKTKTSRNDKKNTKLNHQTLKRDHPRHI